MQYFFASFLVFVIEWTSQCNLGVLGLYLNLKDVPSLAEMASGYRCTNMVAIMSTSFSKTLPQSEYSWLLYAVENFISNTVPCTSTVLQKTRLAFGPSHFTMSFYNSATKDKIWHVLNNYLSLSKGNFPANP